MRKQQTSFTEALNAAASVFDSTRLTHTHASGITHQELSYQIQKINYLIKRLTNLKKRESEFFQGQKCLNM